MNTAIYRALAHPIASGGLPRDRRKPNTANRSTAVCGWALYKVPILQSDVPLYVIPAGATAPYVFSQPPVHFASLCAFRVCRRTIFETGLTVIGILVRWLHVVAGHYERSFVEPWLEADRNRKVGSPRFTFSEHPRTTPMFADIHLRFPPPDSSSVRTCPRPASTISMKAARQAARSHYEIALAGAVSVRSEEVRVHTASCFPFPILI
jgi:hypothetical protein